MRVLKRLCSPGENRTICNTQREEPGKADSRAKFSSTDTHRQALRETVQGAGGSKECALEPDVPRVQRKLRRFSLLILEGPARTKVSWERGEMNEFRSGRPWKAECRINPVG